MLHIYLLPVFNEETVLAKAVTVIQTCLDTIYVDKTQFKVIVLDNASTDATSTIAAEIQKNYPNTFEYVYISKKGRGNAIKSLCSLHLADFYTYMDIDLPIELENLRDFISPIVTNAYDISIVKRLGQRPFWRRILSGFHKIFCWLFLNISFSDPQSGAKTFSRKIALDIFPLSCQNGYFFDSEFLSLANSRNYKIIEIPLTWIETRFPERLSKVKKLRDSLWAFLAILEISKKNFPYRFYPLVSLFFIGVVAATYIFIKYV